MNELLKKGFFLGLGAAVASKERVEKYVNDLVEKKEIAPQEAKGILSELQEKGKGKQNEWNEQFRKEITSSLKQIGFVSREDMNEMNERLEALERKLDTIIQNTNKED
ncbi:phasin family protein [Scopulibacillus cellulosilyticus]|uniref:Phasin family protein n=1 Tax=Scopulibacillus cellulosilyticus TaxID=2665665 RepID=A0ABW2PX89_9BACL